MPASRPVKRKTSLRKKTVDEARTLRKTMSFPEVLLWRELKGNKLGVGFRKQHPVGSYKADFCYADGKLVVEVDGFAHETRDVALRDEKRDAYMRENGFTVLRIPALDVLSDIGAVLDTIRVALAANPPRSRGGGRPEGTDGGGVGQPTAIDEFDTPLHRCAVPLPVNGEDLK